MAASSQQSPVSTHTQSIITPQYGPRPLLIMDGLSKAGLRITAARRLVNLVKNKHYLTCSHQPLQLFCSQVCSVLINDTQFALLVSPQTDFQFIS